MARVGIENLTLESEFDAANARDEEHSWIAVALDRAEDVFVRKVVARHFAGSAVRVGARARRVTIEDCRSEQPVSEPGGYRRQSFLVEGQQVLVRQCRSEHGMNDYATGLLAAGPNVFLDSTASEALGPSGSFESWASGVLYERRAHRRSGATANERQLAGAGRGVDGGEFRDLELRRQRDRGARTGGRGQCGEAIGRLALREPARQADGSATFAGGGIRGGRCVADSGIPGQQARGCGGSPSRIAGGDCERAIRSGREGAVGRSGERWLVARPGEPGDGHRCGRFGADALCAGTQRRGTYGGPACPGGAHGGAGDAVLSVDPRAVVRPQARRAFDCFADGRERVGAVLRNAVGAQRDGDGGGRAEPVRPVAVQPLVLRAVSRVRRTLRPERAGAVSQSVQHA